MNQNEFSLTNCRKTWIFVFSISFFIAALIVSSITASKLYSLSIFGWAIGIPVGTSLFAITFLSTDVLGEVYGKGVARMTVLAGFVVRCFMILFLWFAVSVEPAAFWHNQEAYQSVLSGTGRILFAGIAVYPVSQFLDVFVFHYLKKRHTDKNRLWLRNIASTTVAQTVDSILFVLIAFYGTMPTKVMLTVIGGQIVVKVVIALLDTPAVYFFRNLAEGRPLLNLKG